MKLDLGFKSRYGAVLASMPESSKDDDEEKEPPTCYPQMTISGAAADKLASKVGTDDTITAMVTFRVVGTSARAKRNDEYGSGGEGSSVDLEVTGMENIQIGGSEADEDDEDETAEDALDSYLSEKKGSKE